MSSFLKCPSCQSEVEIGEDSVNQKVICPKCGQKIREKTTEMAADEIKLTPIQTSQSTLNTTPYSSSQTTVYAAPPANGASGGSNLVDSAEDNYVLNLLEIIKVLNYVVCVILCIAQGMGLLSCLGDRYGGGRIFVIPLLLGIISSVFICVLINLVLCWGRGVYRNLAWLKVIANKLPEANIGIK